MAKRVGVILAGCGHRDGSDVGEATIALLALDRMGADVVCAAPDQPQAVVANHLNGEVAPAKPPKRAVLAEAARLTRGPIVSLAALGDRDLDALIIPGGQGVGYSLSNYAEKGELCEVHPDVARLLRAMLAAHKPIGVSSLAAILAARVLGPVAGVRAHAGQQAPARRQARRGHGRRRAPVHGRRRRHRSEGARDLDAGVDVRRCAAAPDRARHREAGARRRRPGARSRAAPDATDDRPGAAPSA